MTMHTIVIGYEIISLYFMVVLYGTALDCERTQRRVYPTRNTSWDTVLFLLAGTPCFVFLAVCWLPMALVAFTYVIINVARNTRADPYVL